MTGERALAVRRRLGLTQIELAALFGVSRDTILRAEHTGRMIPALGAAYRLAEALGPAAVDVLRRDETA